MGSADSQEVAAATQGVMAIEDPTVGCLNLQCHLAITQNA